MRDLKTYTMKLAVLAITNTASLSWVMDQLSETSGLGGALFSITLDGKTG